MEIDPNFSTAAVDFLRGSINKIYEGNMVYCSTADDGIEIWHEHKCTYLEGKEAGVACCAFMNSPVHKKNLRKSVPSFEKHWEQKNYAMALFKLNATHFVFRSDNKQFNFEIPEELQAELVAHAKLINRFAEFKPIIGVISGGDYLKSV